MLNQHVSYPGERTLKRAPARHDKYTSSHISAVGNNPLQNLGSTVSRFCRDIFGFNYIIDTENRDILRFVRYAIQGGIGLFQVHTNSGNSVQLTYFDEQVTTTGEETNQYLQFNYWLDDMFAAIATRDRDAINYLAQLSPKVNYIEARSASFEFLWAMADLYKALFSNRKSMSSVYLRIKGAYKTSDFSGGEEWKNKLTSLYLSPVDVLECLLKGGSESEYNQALEAALITHQTYWKNNAPENWEGAFSLPLMAVAVIAHDMKGYQVTVENDYIPSWLNDNIERKLTFSEKDISPCASASLILTSAQEEKAQLEGKALEVQLSHIEYYLDYFLRSEDTINSFEPMFPILWQAYLKTIDYRFGKDGSELSALINENLDVIAQELDQMRDRFVEFHKKREQEE